MAFFAPLWIGDIRHNAIYSIHYFRKGAESGIFAPFRKVGMKARGGRLSLNRETDGEGEAVGVYYCQGVVAFGGG